MKLPCLLQFRILKVAIKSLFGKPFTTKFPAVSYEPIPQFRGRPRFNKEKCIGCGACAEVCPSKCIDVTDNTTSTPPVRKLAQHLDACIWCGQCERYCTTREGIKQSTEYDCAEFTPGSFDDSVEKELLLCENCGAVIAPVDQLVWLVKKLGPLAFANPTLMLVSHSQLAVVDKGVQIQTPTPIRNQRVMIQCPKCLRKTALVV
jgi:hydrogenase-4 component H